MQRSESSRHCWVDVFEEGYFLGPMRRLFGPRKLRQLHAKSMIVGPRATVLLSVRCRGRESVVKLAAKRVIPDLAKSIHGATIRQATVERADRL
jgi:hypothetical protein